MTTGQLDTIERICDDHERAIGPSWSVRVIRELLAEVRRVKAALATFDAGNIAGERG